MTQETAIGVGTSEGASGTQCDASFFCLARALSGRCSWASLGVVLFESNLSEKGHWRSQSGSRHSFEDLVRALPQRNLSRSLPCGENVYSMVSGCIDRE
jgi:hypothetical protein